MKLRDLLMQSAVDRMWIGSEAVNSKWQREAIGGASVPLTYTRWAPGQPDGGKKETCTEMWTTGAWNDAPCAHMKMYACEVPVPPQQMELRFDCSFGVVDKLEKDHARAKARPLCTYQVFGADGRRSSFIKQEFDGCFELCRQAAPGAQIAEPRTPTQLGYLAHVLRRSGDDGMWMGLRKNERPNEHGWLWVGSNISLDSAHASWATDEPIERIGYSCASMWSDGTYHARGCSRDTRAKKACPCEVPVGFG